MTLPPPDSFRPGIRWKLLATMIPIVVVLVAFLTAIQISQQRRIFESALDRRIALMRQIIHVKGMTLSDNLSRQATNDLASVNLLSLVGSLRAQVGPGRDLSYIILMDANRRAYVHTDHPELEQDTVLSGDNDRFAAEQESRTTHEYVSGDRRYIEFISPLTTGLQRWGWLRLGVSLDSLNREIQQNRAEIEQQTRDLVARTLLTSATFIVLSAILVLLISKRLVRPLLSLTESANELARGNFSAASSIRVHSGDEVGVLSGAFVKMSEDLRRSYRQLEDYSKTLESKVSERTAELEHMTRQAQEARVAAERATSAKSQFLANMSHELRTPLNAIIGYTEMLEEQAVELRQSEMVPDLQKVEAASRHLLSLINDILDLSKIEAGKMTLHLEVFDLAKLVDEVVATVQPLIGRNANRLVVECPRDIGTLHADQTKLRQSLFNLLSNAAKFTLSGTITIRATRTNPDDGGGAGTIRLQVIDTGIGMTPAQMGNLFEAFAQADSTISGRFGGTGLGLAISRRFCRLMGGELTVTSEPGKGSTFTIVLGTQPRARAQAAEPART